MPAAFARSLRSLESDGRGLTRWIAPLALALFTAWGLWMARAEVPLFAASTSARLVRERAVHPLQSAVDGRVRALHARLEQTVAAGALLIELDTDAQELALTEARARDGAGG
ncbi:MAG: biotin/lipoyl-binding protein [Planctomycetes bacterium]|nr:biotin/lipoyl-binding protein [Planctomycetota bacterium]